MSRRRPDPDDPWRDLLSVRERGLWGGTPGVKLGWGARELDLEGVPVEHKRLVGLASAPGHPWDWVDLACEFTATVVGGRGFVLHVRHVPGRVDYEIPFTYEVFGCERNVEVRIVGREISVKHEGAPAVVTRFSDRVSPKGGIAFGLEAGDKVVVSRFQIRVLK